MSLPDNGKQVILDYTNYRGERAIRKVVPVENAFWFGTLDPYHPEPQWLVNVWDVDKQAHRTYAVCNIHSWTRITDDERPEQPHDG
jgi:hypothetical protein